MLKTPASVPARHVAAVVIGNALEFYDFLTYAFFAVYIGRAFFPSSNAASSLLASLGTFGAGFITRPFGGILIGRMGDRLGRKPALTLSFALMGVAIAGIALTPSYAAIGIAAPALAIFFRMLQGFALGGEVGPATAFLLEAAPRERRGFYTSFQSWTQHVAILTAGLVGFVLASTLSEQQLQNFGWRIAFLIGAAIIPVGLAMRRRLPETFGVPDRRSRDRIPLRPYIGVALIGVMLLAYGAIGVYISAYMTTYAIATLHMPANIAFAATVVVGICGVTFYLISGALSDYWGRKPTMLVPTVLLFVSIFPAFHAIAHFHTTTALLVATAVLASLLSLSIPPTLVWMAESLPAPIRSGRSASSTHFRSRSLEAALST